MASADDSVRKPSVEKVRLSPVEETLLATLYFRVRDAASPRPILGDAYAEEVLDRVVDCDFGRPLFQTSHYYVSYTSGRGRLLDEWCQAFIDRHADDEPVTVLHLACGLDSRNRRVRRGSNVLWVDLDRPGVVSLRQRLIPPPDGNYRLIAASVTEDLWLADIPCDRPTCIVAEGLLPWLTPEQGTSMIRRFVEYFPRGQMEFDAVGKIMRRLHWLQPMFRGTKAKFRWGIDSGQELAASHSRLKVRKVVRGHEFMGEGSERRAPWFGVWTPLVSLLPAWKTSTQIICLEF